MEKESKRREFLRNVSLAGMGLIAGCCGKEKERIKELEYQASQSQTQDQVRVENDGTLRILDQNVCEQLWDVWQRQGNTDAHCSPEGDDPPVDPTCSGRKGIHVKFKHKVPPKPGKPPEDRKVNSLCSC